MNVNKKSMVFRTNLAADLESLHKLLLGTKIELISNFDSVIKKLKTQEAIPHPEPQNVKTLPTFWGYSLEDFCMTLTQIPRNTQPLNISTIKIFFNMRVVSDYANLDLIEDPFNYLTFNIVIIGKENNNKEEYINAWHLDRHLGGQENNEAHPIYHMHYGGAKLNGHNLGNTLLLGAPRLVHYPMELVLGIDFILSNFFPNEWKKLIDTTNYPALLRKYQSYFLKPFSLAFSSHWLCKNPTNQWSAHQVCPTLI